MDRASIDRINALSALSRTRALTEAEQAERARLRENYRAAFRAQMRGMLDNLKIEREDGSRVSVKEHFSQHDTPK